MAFVPCLPLPGTRARPCLTELRAPSRSATTLCTTPPQHTSRVSMTTTMPQVDTETASNPSSEMLKLEIPLPHPPPLSTLAHTLPPPHISLPRRLASRWRMLRQLRGRLRKGTVLTLRLAGSLSEALPPPALPFSPPPPLALPALLRALRLAACDPRIAHLHVRLDPLDIGWAKAFEIRRYLDAFRATGKPISFFMEAGGPKEFFLAMGFALYVAPEASLSLRGFTSSGAFVAGVLDKIGIAPQVERIGKYKSAGDQLSRRDMADAQREVLNSILGDVHQVWTASVCEATGIAKDALADFVDRSPWEMQEYVDAGLVTGICYESDLENALKLEYAKKNPFVKQDEILQKPLVSVEVQRYLRRTNEMLLGIAGRKRIAVIRAVGAITSGKNGSNPVSGQTVGSDTLLELIRRVKNDKRYVACLLRCDSPGGSALASDIMWNELRKLADSKPLIASQSDVAASGGYYLSMASEIIAEPLTITGSVGVVTAKPSLAEFYKKVGYAKENVSVGSRYAELLVDNRPFNEAELEYFREGAQQAYRKFVTKAAKSRGKTYDEMHEVAQGRVWTGQQAKEQGLVDHIGGIDKAIEVLKEKVGLGAEDFVRLEEMRVSVSLAERIGLSMGAQTEANVTAFGEPLAMAEVDASMAGLSPVSRFVMDTMLAPVLSNLSILAKSPQTIEGLIKSVVGDM